MAKLERGALTADFSSMSLSSMMHNLWVLLESEIIFAPQTDQVSAAATWLLPFHRLSPASSGREAGAGPPGCDTVLLRVCKDRLHIPVYVRGIALASIPTAYLILNPRHWCDSAYLAKHSPICVSFCCPLSFCAGPAYCSPLSTVTCRSNLPALRQCRAVLFQWLVLQPGTGMTQIYGASKTVLVLVFTNCWRLFLSAWPGSESTLSRNREGSWRNST